MSLVESTFDVPPAIARAWSQRGYVPAQLELARHYKALGERLGMGGRQLRLAAPHLTPINRIASVHVVPIELGPITCDDYLVAHWIIDDWIRRSEFAPAPSIKLIKGVVAEAFQIPISNMESERRTNEVVFPRMIAMYLAKALRPDSYPKIGRAFGGRDHTTILHAVRKIERMMSCDPEFFARIECLKSRIGARG
jgi:hypothetical protein